jgi:hypothetical protein
VNIAKLPETLAPSLIVATGSDTKGECNMPKCTLARRSQLALVPRQEYRKSEPAHPIQVSHP